MYYSVIFLNLLILDILLLYKEDTLSSKKISKLEGLGFTYKGDIIASLYNQEIDKSRHFFAYYDDLKQFDYAHIHALHKNSEEANEKIAFRNTLLKDSKSVQKYNHFKKNYLEKKISREEYRISKEDIIRKILMKK